MQVFHILPIVCLFAVWALPVGAMSPMSPAEAWVKFRLKKDLTLVNGAEIYNTFVEHYRSSEMVEFGSPQNQAIYDLTLAWATYHEADKREFTLILPKGTSVLECLRKIAEQRQERLTTTSNYCVIVPSARPPTQRSYMQKGQAPSAELAERIQSFIPCSIILREPNQDGLEKFLTHRFQLGWESHNKTIPCPHRVNASEAAREKMATLNLIGIWAYDELLDTTSYVCGLQWQINGTTIQIDLPAPGER